MKALLLLCLFLYQDDAKQELEKFQGVWKPKTIERMGQDRGPVLAIDRHTLLIVADRFAFSLNVGIVKVNPVTHEIDLVIKDGLNKGSTLPGIYELNGDSLRIALPGPGIRNPKPANRPKSMKTTDRDLDVIIYSFVLDPQLTKAEAEKGLQERETSAKQLSRRLTDQAPVTHAEFQKLLEKMDAMEKRMVEIEKKLAEKK